MNWGSWALWGFVATMVMTTTEAIASGFGLTRMSLPYIMGTMITPNRDKAKLYGFFLHFLNGWAFSLLYVLAFISWGKATWWLGTIIGLVHSLFVLVVVMTTLPGVHPRMASETHGPTATRQLEPPGFLGMNYGLSTPVSVILSHAVFGALLGAFYRLN
jgi:uncharacterized membrane protein YagU involved in acid resistance